MTNRAISIRPTYYHNVERILFDAGELDLIVKFTKTDPEYPVPFITEVTVNEGKSDDAVSLVREALSAIAA